MLTLHPAFIEDMAKAGMIAAGGVGKSSLATAISLALASGKNLVGQQLYRGPQAIWLTSLEDSRDELERQIAAARIYYGISPHDCTICVMWAISFGSTTSAGNRPNGWGGQSYP